MIRITQINSVRVPIKLVELSTTIFPFIVIVLSFCVTLFVVIKAIRTDLTSRWNRIRTKLALLFSAGVFYEVKQNETIQTSPPTTINDTNIEPLVLEDETDKHNKHSCYTQERLIIGVQPKNNFYSMYVLSIPVQIAMICLVTLGRIFVNEINLDTCASYMTNPPSEYYYYCRLSNEVISPQAISKQKIFEFCNSTKINGNYSEKLDDIICLQYYFDKTKIIEIITHLFIWQKILAGLSVYIIRFFHELYRRCSPFTKVHPICFYCCLLLMIIINFAFVCAAVGAYAIIGIQDTKSILTFNSITAGSLTLALTFFLMNIFSWFIIPENTEYLSCVFHVTYKQKTT